MRLKVTALWLEEDDTGHHGMMRSNTEVVFVIDRK